MFAMLGKMKKKTRKFGQISYYSFVLFFQGTLLEVFTENFLPFGNPYLKNSTTRQHSVLSNLEQILELVKGTQEAPWSKMMVF